MSQLGSDLNDTQTSSIANDFQAWTSWVPSPLHKRRVHSGTERGMRGSGAHSRGLDLSVLAKLVGDDKVDGKNDLDALGLGHFHDLANYVGTGLVKERCANLHLVENLAGARVWFDE